MKELKSKEDIRLLIDTFYEEAMQDSILAPVFSAHIVPEQWDRHKQRIYSFWNAALLLSPDYKGNPFSAHIPLRLSQEHFDQWLNIFENTVRKNFEGSKAEEAVYKSKKMAEMFQLKLRSSNQNRIQINVK